MLPITISNNSYLLLIMPLLGNQRTFARIRINKEPDKTFELIQEILDQMKLKPKKIIKEKYFIRGKTKTSFLKNKFGQDFHIMSKPEENGSVIDIYYNGISLTGPDKSLLIEPFYKKLIKITSSDLPIEINCIDISDEDIMMSADKNVRSDRTSVIANTVADEITKLSKLKSEGHLSEDEFTKMKNDLINKM